MESIVFLTLTILSAAFTNRWVLFKKSMSKANTIFLSWNVLWKAKACSEYEVKQLQQIKSAYDEIGKFSRIQLLFFSACAFSAVGLTGEGHIWAWLVVTLCALFFTGQVMEKMGYFMAIIEELGEPLSNRSEFVAQKIKATQEANELLEVAIPKGTSSSPIPKSSASRL